MSYRLNPTLAEFLRALARANTFNITRNKHIIFGLLLGIPIPILVLWLDIYLTGKGTLTLSAVLERLALHPGYHLFLIVPFITGVILGAFARRLLEEMRKHDFRLEGVSGSAPVSVSIGVAAYPDDAGDARGVLECADAALYRAKKEGRGRIAAYEKPV